MKNLSIVLLILGIMILTGCKQQLTYPVAKKGDVTDDYFGTKIADPYRWMENDTSKEVADWVKAENELTQSYLSKISFRGKMKEELTRIWNFPKYSVPFREGEWYFFFKNDGLQNQSVLYDRKGLDGDPAVLLDPNKLSEDGTVALNDISPSHDGKYLAYSIARSGSDWNEIYVMEIATGKKLSDSINWVKFSGLSWQGDGFYYSRFDAPGAGAELTKQNENHKVYFHKIGTQQSEDKLIYANPKEPKHNFAASVSEDEHFLFLYESATTDGVALYYRDLTKGEQPFKLIAPGFDNEYAVIDNITNKLFVITNHEAPKKKLVMIDPEKPEPANWKTVIPERDEVLESVQMVGDRFVAQYMKNACSKLFLYSVNGKFLDEVALPGIGTVTGFSGKKGDFTAFYGFTSFAYPSTTFKYDVSSNKSEVYTKPEVDFNPDDFEVKQVWYTSKDQTSVPMFIISKKGLELNGKNPTLLYGYGGFNISLTPSFSISRLLFLMNGGVYAVANLRGGGEFGEEWHKAGTKERKQNVFDDFIAAAEYLIAEKYTSSDKMAMMGGSNGGLLVGAVMTQRPELFHVAIPQVGVMDMLRYHKFTIGHAWAGDYGTSDSADAFNYLIKYSPLHNLKKGVNYPATLAFTADHDDRVVPAHTFKFMATLQECQAGPNPVLVRIETKAGHGAGKPTAKLIEETTDLWSFVFYNLGMTMK